MEFKNSNYKIKNNLKNKKYNIDINKLIKKNPFILAPMDDVTDIAFRELCEKYGASFSITELTSIEALIRDKVFNSRYLKGDLNINVVQLFGSNPDHFLKAAKKLKGVADIIDVNFGCPSPSVTSNNSGSILLNDPKNVGKIIKILVDNLDIPITAKIRLGYKKNTYLEIAKEIEKAGASLISVHGRTAEQKYSGKANWEAIKEIYENSNIPIIGNGDIKNEKDIDKYLYKYCDAIMIGRAAIGNPLLFKKFNYYLKNNKKIIYNNKQLKEEKKKEFLEYIDLIKKYEKKYKFPKIELKIQKQAMWFFKGINDAKELRKKIIKNKNDINSIINIIKKF